MTELSPEMRAAAQAFFEDARCENCGDISLTRHAFGCHRCGHWPEGCYDGGTEKLAQQLGFDQQCRSPHCWAALVIALVAFGLALAAITGVAVLLGGH